MASEIGQYSGREQSFIKHRFLTNYLQAAAYKTLQARSRTFNFVDAFAGPWSVSDEKYSDASFDQALRTLEDVRANLGRNGLENIKIRFCFCERDAGRAKRLREYAEAHSQFEIGVFHGSFEDNLDGVSNVCHDGFTFTFIDPTGWNIRSNLVLDFLKNQKGEFLLNFMAEHVNRHVEYSQVAASFGRFLADPDWEDQFSALPSDWGNERKVLFLLKRKIRSTGAAKYVPDFPILKPLEDRVKMRLILGTNSAKGLEVFRDTQWRVERLEIETLNNLRNDRQTSLFTDDEIVAMQQDIAGIGCSKFRREAEARIVKLVDKDGALPFDRIATDILEAVPMRMTQIKALTNDMKSRGLIKFDLPHGKRVPQESTYVSLANSP